jgi:hypothetical protein
MLPHEVEAAVAVAVAKEGPYRLNKPPEVFLPQGVLLKAVRQRGRDTMHPHPITAMLRADAIRIHPAKGDSKTFGPRERRSISQLQNPASAAFTEGRSVGRERRTHPTTRPCRAASRRGNTETPLHLIEVIMPFKG